MLFLLLAFEKKLRKHFSTPTLTYGDAHMLESKNVKPIFFFLFQFLHYLYWWKREGEMKEEYFKYILPTN